MSDVALGEDAPIFPVMSTMRAMRRLKPDPVPDELLERLVEAATWAPSGGNLQAFEFVVVTDRATMAELAVLWRRCVDLYVDTIARDSPTANEKVRAAVRFQAEHFHETPAVIVACYRDRPRRPETALRIARGLPATDAAKVVPRLPRIAVLGDASSVYPGVQNLLLAARALGLAANLTSWHLLLEHEFKHVLGIPRGVSTFALIPIGWPRGRFGPVTRRPAREVIHRDRW